MSSPSICTNLKVEINFGPGLFEPLNKNVVPIQIFVLIMLNTFDGFFYITVTPLLYGMENSIPVQIKQLPQPPAETIQHGNMVVTFIWQWLQSHVYKPCLLYNELVK